MNGIFPNSKPKIFGSDTHAASLSGEDTHTANLSGALSKSVSSQTGRNGAQGILSTGGTNDILVTSITVTPTKASNLIILKWSAYRTNDSNMEIREGANVIATINGSSSGVLTLNTIIEDASVSAHTYNFYVLFGGLFFQIGDLWVTYGAVVNIDDTHAAELTGEDTHAAELIGSNTQRTHESEVLP